MSEGNLGDFLPLSKGLSSLLAAATLRSGSMLKDHRQIAYCIGICQIMVILTKKIASLKRFKKSSPVRFAILVIAYSS